MTCITKNSKLNKTSHGSTLVIYTLNHTDCTIPRYKTYLQYLQVFLLIFFIYTFEAKPDSLGSVMLLCVVAVNLSTVVVLMVKIKHHLYKNITPDLLSKFYKQFHLKYVT